MIQYIMIILISSYTAEPQIHSLEFNSAAQCYEVKKQLEKTLERSKPLILCLKK